MKYFEEYAYHTKDKTLFGTSDGLIPESRILWVKPVAEATGFKEAVIFAPSCKEGRVVSTDDYLLVQVDSPYGGDGIMIKARLLETADGYELVRCDP